MPKDCSWEEEEKQCFSWQWCSLQTPFTLKSPEQKEPERVVRFIPLLSMAVPRSCWRGDLFSSSKSSQAQEFTAHSSNSVTQNSEAGGFFLSANPSPLAGHMMTLFTPISEGMHCCSQFHSVCLHLFGY